MIGKTFSIIAASTGRSDLHQVVQRAIAKRSSSSGGSSDVPRTTFTTAPPPEGVNVTK